MVMVMVVMAANDDAAAITTAAIASVATAEKEKKRMNRLRLTNRFARSVHPPVPLKYDIRGAISSYEWHKAKEANKRWKKRKHGIEKHCIEFNLRHVIQLRHLFVPMDSSS